MSSQPRMPTTREHPELVGRHDRVLVALDLKAAFQNVSAMLNNIEETDLDLASVLSRWYTDSTTQKMHFENSYAKISACGFAAAVDPVTRFVLAELRRLLDDGAKLFAYLDDWYIWITPQFLPDALALVTAATRSINLGLQPSKIQVWAASGTDPIPLHLLEKVKPTLECLSGHLHIQITASHVLLYPLPQQSCQETSFLRRFHVHMVRHDVDFIGGDCNMSAFSAVGEGVLVSSTTHCLPHHAAAPVHV